MQLFYKQIKSKKTMKELAVKNYKTAEGQKISQGGNEFTVKPIVEQTDVDQCRVNFVEGM